MGFKEKGTVVRKFVAQSGKFGSLTLDVAGERGSTKLDIVTFDCVDDFAELQPGAAVVITGRLGMNKITSKNKEPIMVDGFAKWVPQLIATKVEVGLGQAKKPAREKAPPAVQAEDNSDIPF